MTYWAFGADIDGDSFAEIFAQTLRAISVQLESRPRRSTRSSAGSTGPRPIPTISLPPRRSSPTSRRRAERALTLERCPAAAIWRSILGENERGPVFPLPPGCDEKGNEIKDVAAVAAVGSKEASGFA